MLIDLRGDGLNMYIFCPFIGCFCLICASFASDHSVFGKYYIVNKELSSLGQIFAVIPYLILKKIHSSKRASKDGQEYNKMEDQNDNIKIKPTILLGFLDFLYSFVFYFGDEIFGNKLQIYVLSSFVLFLMIFQKLILENRIYRHQIVAFLVFFVLDFVYIIIVILDKKLNYDIKQIIIIIFGNILLTLEIVYEKKIMKDSMIFLYKLCILVGVFSFCFTLITSITTTIIESNIDIADKNKIYSFNYKYYLEDVSGHVLLEIIAIVVYILFNCIQSIVQFIIIKHLSPNHILITYILFAIYHSILIKIQNIEISTLTTIFSFVLYILLFFVTFVFLEFIQLNFCGINKDITFKIGLRHDVNKYMQSFSEDEDKDENNEENENCQTIELNERNESATSSEIDTYNDE